MLTWIGCVVEPRGLLSLRGAVLHLPGHLLVFLWTHCFVHVWCRHITGEFDRLRELLGADLREDLSTLVVNDLADKDLLLLLRDLLRQGNSVQAVWTPYRNRLDGFLPAGAALASLMSLIECYMPLITCKLSWELLWVAYVRLRGMHRHWVVHFLMHSYTVVSCFFLIANVRCNSALV